MKGILKKRENRITAIFFLITIITAISPLFSRYCINGHDLEYHLLRIESLKEGILIGHPFMKVNTLFFGGAGYASTMFYSDLFMHVPALLRVIHVGIGASFHIYTAMIFVLCYLSTFYCVWKMSGSKFAGTVAAILLTLCPYHMDDMVVRTACGENAAFIFLPIAIYGIYNVLYEEMDKPWLFGLGYAGLIVTHPATCILAVAFGVVTFLIDIKKLIKAPALLIKLCAVSLVALLVTAYQWVPMLEQFADAKFYVANNWTDLLDASVSFADVASSSFPCVGFVLFALVLPRFFLNRKDSPILLFVDVMMIAAVLFSLGATNIMPWERLAKYFGFLQFPWRLFIMSSVLLAMADAIVLFLFLERISEQKRGMSKEIILIVIFAITAQMAITHQNENSMGYYDYSDDYYDYKPYTGAVIAGEWLPQTVKDAQALIDQSEHMIYDDGSEASFKREKAKVFAKIDKGHSYVDVPFLYYKGYTAILTDASGNTKELSVTGEGENGLCRVMLDGEGGDLTVYYKGTILQLVSLIISILFLLLVFDRLYLRNKYKKKLKSRAAAAGANLGKIACFTVITVLAVNLSACTGYPVATSDGGYTDPNEMIDYLKNKNGTVSYDEMIDKENLTRVNFSQKGYDEDGRQYALLVDESSGEEVISVLTLEEAQKYTEDTIMVEKGLYEKLLKEEAEGVLEKYRSDSLKDRIMNETDALLCMEVFPDTAKRNGIEMLAEELGSDILSIPDEKVSDMVDKYDCAALLAKASYVMPDWEGAEEASKKAEQYFKDAEKIVDDEGEPVASRLWAAAELYRLTGQKTYRSVVDAIAMDIVPEGFSYEEPGFFGLFAYLMSPYPTNYNVCTNMMDVVFTEANKLIREPVDAQFYDKRIDENTLKDDEDDGVRMLSEMFLVTMTNYVSVSVEYKGFVQERLSFIFGANLSGVDLTGDDMVLCDAPKLFILAGLSAK